MQLVQVGTRMGGGREVSPAHSVGFSMHPSPLLPGAGSGGGGEGQWGAHIHPPPWEETPGQLVNPLLSGCQMPGLCRHVQTRVSRRSQSLSVTSGGWVLHSLPALASGFRVPPQAFYLRPWVLEGSTDVLRGAVQTHLPTQFSRTMIRRFCGIKECGPKPSNY